MRTANIGGLFGSAYSTGIFGYPYAGYNTLYPSSYTGLEGLGYGAAFQGNEGVNPYPYANIYNQRISNQYCINDWSNSTDTSSSGNNGYSKGLYNNKREEYYAFKNMDGRRGGYGYYRGLI